MFAGLYALLAGLFAAALGGGGSSSDDSGGGLSGSGSAGASGSGGSTTPPMSMAPSAPMNGGASGGDTGGSAAPDTSGGGTGAIAAPQPAPAAPTPSAAPAPDPALAPIVAPDPAPVPVAAPDPAPSPAPAPDPGPAPAPDPVNTVYIPDVPDSAYDIGWAGLSGEEQYVVELINRARLDPDEELGRQSDGFAAGVTSAPKQALAVDAVLADVARDHSEDMDDRNFFAHTNPDGDSPFDRTSDAGYDGNGAGENIGVIGAFSVSDAQARAQAHHDNLWDSDGHQQNFMNPNWNEIGVGYDYGDHQFVDGGTNYPGATFVTEMLGRDGDSYLTGTVIDDSDGDAFYDIGEGQGDVKITAYNASGTYTTSTWDAGGYTLELPPGTYTVVFHGGDLDGVFETQVIIGSQNVKLDVIEDRDAIDAQVTTSLTLSATAPPDAGAALLADLDTGEGVSEEMPVDPAESETDEDLLVSL